MTVLIAIRRNDGGITMAADRRVTCSDGWSLPSKDGKVAKVGPMLVAVCGDAAPGELLLTMRLPKRVKVDALAYLRYQLVPKLRSALGNEFAETDAWGALIALDGRIFELDGDGAVCEINRPWWCMGSGKSVASGFLCGAQWTGLDFKGQTLAQTERMVRDCIDIVGRFDTNVGDGYDVIHGGAP